MKTLPIIFFSPCLAFAQANLPVIVHETFDENRYGWFERKTPAGSVYLEKGKYVLESSHEGWMTTVTPYLEPDRDFSIEATFTQVEGKTNNGLGLVWGYDGKSKLNSFIITSGGYYRIFCYDKNLGVDDSWVEKKDISPLGRPNVLKVEQRQSRIYFYLNGKLLTTAKAFPHAGNSLGFVAYTEMKLHVDDFIFSHDIKIPLVENAGPGPLRENLGPHVNTIYDEVSPKVSADGKTLYFGRKASPGNVGGDDDQEDIWVATSPDGYTWSKSVNPGPPLNTPSTNNLISVSTDNNTFLFHSADGFTVIHRTTEGWTQPEDLGIHFQNESDFLEGCLSPDGKAIIFVAKLKGNVYYTPGNRERDIYICLKRSDGTWGAPFNAGRDINSPGDEYSPFLAADGRTMYFATNGRPGYGGVDIFMSKRMSDDWRHWSPPVNLGLGINTVGFDAYYTLPASGTYGYMVSNIQTLGLADIVQFKIPPALRPDPVVLVSGRVLNAKTGKPLGAVIRFDDLSTGKEVGEARVDPRTGDYDIALPAGRNYGLHAAAPGYLSVNENIEITELKEYSEVRRDLLLVPIAIGESIQLKNVFFNRSTPTLLPESYPELDRLADIMKENPSVVIELSGHTDNIGSPEANLELSEKRVVAVKEYLVRKGIDANRITGKGYGGSRPIAPSDTEENRKLNRRVEFKVVKK